jgi:hypothetical protein
MSFNQKFAQLQPFSLAGSGVSIGDTSITLTSFTSIDGDLLTMADFGNIGYGTIEPNNGVYEEQISFTGVTQNGDDSCTLTGVKNVLFVTPYTQSSGTKKSHIGGAKFVVSNTSAMYQTLVDYIDGIAIAGSPVASTTTLGISEISVTPVDIGTPIVVGINDPILPTSDEKAAMAGTGTPSASNKFATADIIDTSSSLGTSDTKVPSQKAVKNAFATVAGVTTKDITAGSTTQNIAHGLGRIPKTVKIVAWRIVGSYLFQSITVYNGTTQNAQCFIADGNGSQNIRMEQTDFLLAYETTNVGGPAYQKGVITFDATNIIITWTKSSITPSAGTYYLMWEAI